MASSSSTTQTFYHNIISMLNRENYDFLSFKLKIILRAKDLWEVVENVPKTKATFSQVASGILPRQGALS